MSSRDRYADLQTRKYVAVGSADHKSKSREFAVIYEETAKEILLISIHPLKPYQKQNRIASGRWKKI
ncbi:MAG: hypothetical protein AAB916_02805 [Patescibacteria group bacterium]